MKKQYNAEQIIRLHRQAEVIINQGKSIQEACRELSISDATYYKWRKEYGGMQVRVRQKDCVT